MLFFGEVDEEVDDCVATAERDFEVCCHVQGTKIYMAFYSAFEGSSREESVWWMMDGLRDGVVF